MDGTSREADHRALLKLWPTDSRYVARAPSRMMKSCFWSRADSGLGMVSSAILSQALSHRFLNCANHAEGIRTLHKRDIRDMEFLLCRARLWSKRREVAIQEHRDLNRLGNLYSAILISHHSSQHCADKMGLLSTALNTAGLVFLAHA